MKDGTLSDRSGKTTESAPSLDDADTAVERGDLAVVIEILRDLAEGIGARRRIGSHARDLSRLERDERRDLVTSSQRRELRANLAGELMASVQALRKVAAPGSVARHPLARFTREATRLTILERHTRDFVGRGYVFRDLDRYIASDDFRSGYICIAGEPGIGKTAFAARLAGDDLVAHFNERGAGATPAALVANVCAQLVIQYDLPFDQVPESASQDPELLQQVMRDAVAHDKQRRVRIVIDALDEMDPGTGPLRLPRELPDGVHVVITTRPRTKYLDVRDLREISLRADDSRNLDDIRAYIDAFLGRYAIRFGSAALDASARAALVDRSEGNFMYLKHVLPAIREGLLHVDSLEDVRSLPRGLLSYYDVHLDLMRQQDPEHYDVWFIPVLCVLSIVREPISIQKLSTITRLEVSIVRKVVDTWYEFLNEDCSDRIPKYRVYHTSFQDYLAERHDLSIYHGWITDAFERQLPPNLLTHAAAPQHIAQGDALARDLRILLLAAFSLGELEQLVERHLRVRLEDLVAPNAPRPELIRKLVAACTQLGCLRQLAEGVVGERPYQADVVAFAARHGITHVPSSTVS